MKIVGLILTIFMAFSAAASAHVDICATSKAYKSQACEDSPQHGPSQSSDKTPHGHCNLHCFHQCFYLSLPRILQFNFTEEFGISPYQIAYAQTILEGPFRPPLT